MATLSDVTALTVNFKTPDLTYDCLNTFRKHYPEVPHIVIDNGGCVESVKLLRKMADKELIQLVENAENVGHGPALNQGIELMETAYAFLLDSDTRTEHGGFLEKMLEKFDEDDNLYAIGWLRYVNPQSGVAYRDNKSGKHGGLPYVHPYACLIDIAKYHTLTPFTHHGAPATAMMNHVKEIGYNLADFPTDEYFWHKIGGTRGIFRGHWRVKTSEPPGPWRRMRM